MNDKTGSGAGAIAIVGVSALFPGSTNNRGFWNDIMTGRDLISDIPDTHWLIQDYYDPTPMTPDKTYAKRGAFLSEVPFDPMEFSMPPSNIMATDTSQLLGLMVARNVLEDAAQGPFSGIDRDRISVILGTASASELTIELGSRIQRPVWVKALRESGLPEAQVQEICDRIAGEYVPWKESSFPGLLGNVVAGRIANHFNLGGTNCIVDAACASSLASITMGAMELIAGKSDLVIVGGVDTLNDIFMFMCFSQTPALSPSGDCRPFSDQADGTMLGEGLCMFALRRLEDAERDGDRIYAVLKGFGSSSDGKSKSVYAPVSKGQAKALRRAYEMAGYSPGTVELMEAHGTGTKAGDAAEFAGLASVFDDGTRQDRQWCALGSVKSQVGHTKGTAGAAGMFKAVMALRHKAYPPTIKVERPNPGLEIGGSPFYLNTSARPWIRGFGHPRRASVSAFGFGGSNFHVTLEEYTGPGKKAWRLRTMPSELLLFSEQDAPAMMAKCEALRASLTDDDGLLAYLARETQEGFNPRRPARLGLVAADMDDLRRKLETVAEELRRRPEQPIASGTGIYYAYGGSPGKIALLFPGQGSQYVGMGADIAMAFDEARSVWDRAASLGLDDAAGLHHVVFPQPAFTKEESDGQRRRLQATEWAQPAIGAMSLSIWSLLRTAGLKPDLLAGHSFGELSALCAAGVLEESEMLRAARKRGELMAAAAAKGNGAMSAVFGSMTRTLSMIEEMGLGVTAANHNGPNQVVISGDLEQIGRFEERLSAEGIRYQRLSVSTAFHSPLVAPCVPDFRAYLADTAISKGVIEVLSNADGQPFSASADRVRDRLADQIAKPVLFAETVAELYEHGVRTFVEVGPGAVLTGLVEQILEGHTMVAVPTDRKGQHGVSSLWHAFGRLAASGVALDLRPFWEDDLPAVDPRSRKKPAFTIPISGINTGKPYPPVGGAAALPKPNLPVATEQGNANLAAPPYEGKQASADIRSTMQKPADMRPTMQASADIRSTMQAPFLPESAPPVSAPAAQLEYLYPAVSEKPSYSGSNVLPLFHEFQEEPMSNSIPLTQQSALLSAITELQRQTVEAHTAYQRAMADSHIAFLRTAEVSLAGLNSLVAGGIGAPVPAAIVAQPPSQPSYQWSSSNAPMPPVHREQVRQGGAEAPERMPAAPALPPAPVFMAPAAIAPPIFAVQTPPAPAVQVEAAAVDQAATAPAQAVGVRDVRTVMLEVVAEKTGYPVEMLDFDTELEAGLGIDSIKRVEILSAVQDQLPELPEVQPGELAALNTLGEIADYMNRALGEGGAAAGKK